MKYMMWLATSALIWTLNARAADCTLGERYYALANTAKAEYRDRDALQFLEQAVNVCPNYTHWQELGELAKTFGETELNERAASAFKSAYETYAKTPAQQARSAAHFAELLLYSDNNPKRAETWIFQAKQLDPDSEWIANLAVQIVAAGESLTSDMITRGFFSDLADKGPVMRVKLTPDLEAAGSDASQSGGAGTVNLFQDYPLLFSVGSAEPYPESRRMIEQLAKVIGSDERFAGRKFVFIGHADVRGDSDANMLLSLRRAMAVRDIAIEISASLKGRIRAEGKGESQPRDSAMTDEAHRLNRRVQVVLE